MVVDERASHWAARPFRAGLIRLVVLLIPIAGSIAFIRFASQLIAVPTGSFVLFISWWVLIVSDLCLAWRTVRCAVGPLLAHAGCMAARIVERHSWPRSKCLIAQP